MSTTAHERRPRSLELALRCVPESVSEAREAVRHFVGPTHGAVLADALLVVSELVTNAIRYAPGPIDLVLCWHGDQLRIEVHDTSSGAPRRLTVTPDSVHGRGLLIVGAIARAWGDGIRSTGKVVWAEVGEPARLANTTPADETCP